MNGLAVSYTGTKDNEIAASWVRVACFGDAVGDLAPRLLRGVEIYIEGRLSLRNWTDADGRERSGLSVACGASAITVMGVRTKA